MRSGGRRSSRSTCRSAPVNPARTQTCNDWQRCFKHSKQEEQFCFSWVQCQTKVKPCFSSIKFHQNWTSESRKSLNLKALFLDWLQTRGSGKNWKPFKDPKKWSGCANICYCIGNCIYYICPCNIHWNLGPRKHLGRKKKVLNLNPQKSKWRKGWSCLTRGAEGVFSFTSVSDGLWVICCLFFLFFCLNTTEVWRCSEASGPTGHFSCGFSFVGVVTWAKVLLNWSVFRQETSEMKELACR